METKHGKGEEGGRWRWRRGVLTGECFSLVRLNCANKMPPYIARQQGGLLDELLCVVLAKVALACIVACAYVFYGLVFGYGHKSWRASWRVGCDGSDTIADLAERPVQLRDSF